jgi:hypothetical protein
MVSIAWQMCELVKREGGWKFCLGRTRLSAIARIWGKQNCWGPPLHWHASICVAVSSVKSEAVYVKIICLHVVIRHKVVHLVEALCYDLEGRRFNSWWCHWNFSSFWSHYGPGVDSASNISEYQEYFLGRKGGQCVGLTTLPLSSANCFEIWEP